MLKKRPGVNKLMAFNAFTGEAQVDEPKEGNTSWYRTDASLWVKYNTDEYVDTEHCSETVLIPKSAYRKYNKFYRAKGCNALLDSYTNCARSLASGIFPIDLDKLHSRIYWDNFKNKWSVTLEHCYREIRLRQKEGIWLRGSGIYGERSTFSVDQLREKVKMNIKIRSQVLTFFFFCKRSLRSSGSFFFSQINTHNIDTRYKTINIQASVHLSVPAGTKKRARNRPIEKIKRTNFTILEVALFIILSLLCFLLEFKSL